MHCVTTKSQERLNTESAWVQAQCLALRNHLDNTCINKDAMHSVSTNMDKYKNKYRIASTRLKTWDYGSNASYFVTINTKNRLHYFGEIQAAAMKLSEIGKIVEIEWLKTFEMRPDMNLLMADFVVMPNHFHAIIIIGENEFNLGNGNVGDAMLGVDGMIGRDEMHGGDAMIGRDAMHSVSTIEMPGESQPKNQFGPQSKNLASIIRGFKSAVTINGRKIDPHFAWQPRYHDRIIRDSISFFNISSYIRNNPKNWEKDKFHTS